MPDDTLRLLKWTKRLKRQRIYRLLERLTRMSPTEVAQRVRVGLRRLPPFHERHAAAYRQDAEQCAAEFLRRMGSDPRSRLAAQLDEHFFFGPSARAALAAEMRADCAASAARTIAMADAATTTGVTLLGQTVRLSPSLDWQADPATGRRHWPDGWLDEAGAIGVAEADVKFVWELNRHQFLTQLAAAYWLTDEERHVRTAIALVDSWIAANTPGRGVNWCSHLEIAMRSISWLWTMPFALSWPDLDPAFLRRWLESVAHHYFHLARNLSVFTDPTNHLIGEATGLFMLATCLPDLPQAEEQAQRCRALLLRELATQTHTDGVNREQAASYHRFVLDFCVQLLVLTRGTLPQPARELIERMYAFGVALGGAHGIAPMIGDSDDARALPFLELVGWSFADVRSTGARLFARPEWQDDGSDQPIAAALLLHGTPHLPVPRVPTTATTEPFRAFADGGYCFLRSRGEIDAELIFDVGPLGLWPNASHGHADALSIYVRVNGHFVLDDSGTGAYFAGEESRNRFRATAAHNTVTVDGLDQADIFGTFKWVNPFRTRLLDSCADGLVHATAEHDGYTRLRAGVTHRRTIVALPGGGWLVVDWLRGRGVHRFTQHFHFPAAGELERAGDAAVAALGPSLQLGLKLTPAGGGAAKKVTRETAAWSDRYGAVRPAPEIVVEVEAPAPAVMAVLLEPFASGAAGAKPPRTATVQLLPEGAVLCELAASTQRERVVINPGATDVALPDGMRTDARACYLRHAADGSLAAAVVTGAGARLVAGSVELACSPGRAWAVYGATP